MNGVWDEGLQKRFWNLRVVQNPVWSAKCELLKMHTWAGDTWAGDTGGWLWYAAVSYQNTDDVLAVPGVFLHHLPEDTARVYQEEEPARDAAVLWIATMTLAGLLVEQVQP